jgi:hypothetical protein
MVQRRRCPCLAAKSLYRVGIARDLFGKELKSDHAPKTGIFGPVNDTHSSATQLLNHAVMGDKGADHPSRAKPEKNQWRYLYA